MNSSVSYDAFVPVHDDVDKYHCCYLVNSNKAIVAGPFSSIESACEGKKNFVAPYAKDLLKIVKTYVVAQDV